MKTKPAKRTIILGTKSIENLGSHLNHQDQERTRAGKRWQEQNLIFPSTVGSPMDQRNLLRDFKATLERAGLPDFRFQDLRHTAIFNMLNQNLPLTTLAHRVGLSRPGLILDSYGHLIPDTQGEFVEKIDDVVLPTTVELP